MYVSHSKLYIVDLIRYGIIGNLFAVRFVPNLKPI